MGTPTPDLWPGVEKMECYDPNSLPHRKEHQPLNVWLQAHCPKASLVRGFEALPLDRVASSAIPRYDTQSSEAFINNRELAIDLVMVPCRPGSHCLLLLVVLFSI